MAWARVKVTQTVRCPVTRRPSERKPAASFPRRTAVELAEALGVHRNTIASWRYEGAPEQLDEFQWRTWAAARASTGKGYDCPKDPEPELLQLLVAAGVNDYRRRQAVHQPVLGTGDAPNITVPTAAAKEPAPVTAEDRKALADAIIAETKALDAQADSLKRRNVLVHVDALHPLLDAWLLAFDQVIIAGLATVPAQCSASPETQAAVRNTLDRELRALRQKFGDETEQRLKAFLEQLARSAA
jgi:hypothetical protein